MVYLLFHQTSEEAQSWVRISANEEAGSTSFPETIPRSQSLTSCTGDLQTHANGSSRGANRGDVRGEEKEVKNTRFFLHPCESQDEDVAAEVKRY